MTPVEHSAAAQWIGRYEHAWRTAGTQELAHLFTPDATYLTSPYADAIEGLEAIGEMWEAGRRGPDEKFTMTSALVAVDGDVAVARVEVHYLDDREREWRDLWVMQFDDQGLCRAFEEWPFAPGQDDGH